MNNSYSRTNLVSLQRLFRKRHPGLSTLALVNTILLAGLGAQAQEAGGAGTNAPVKLQDVLVQGYSETSIAATNAVTSLKSEIPLLQTPQAVSVVSRTLLDQQGVRRLDDALENVAGVTVGGYYSEWDYYRIRGFDAAFNTFFDGLRGDYGMNAELFGLERVEVVKGPASTLYGPAPLGGLVNLVSKRPRPETFADVQFTAGSYGFLEPAVDLGAALNDEKSVYMRLNALYRDQDSFVDYANKQRFYVAPALTWEISPQTTITFLTQFMHDEGLLAWPLPAVGTVLPNVNGQIPIERFVGEPDGEKMDQWRARLGYELRHEVNETFAFRQNLAYNHMEQTWPDVYYPSSLDADQRTLYRYPYDYQEKLDWFGADNALEAKFETGEVEHFVSLGVDYYYTRSDSATQQIDYGDFPGSYPAIDLFNPVYGAPAPVYASQSSSVTRSDIVGVYLQDHLKFWEKFTLTLGGRFDWSSSGDDSVDAFTPRAGVTYEFVPGLAAYASYSQSFEPQWFSRDSNGDVVNPERGENFEIGLKAELLEGRLRGQLSLYHLTRQDVATANPSTPDPFDSIVSGEQRSRGVEVEGAYQILPGLALSAAYAYIDAEITEDNSLPVGARLAGVPEHSFSSWLSYTLQDGPLRGLGFGAGGRYYTEQSGDSTYANSFELPAYGLLDAAVYYRRGAFSAQVNVSNLLDERYFAGAYNDLYVLPGEPITVRGTVGWSF